MDERFSAEADGMLKVQSVAAELQSVRFIILGAT
jgi:hypothetical protein